MSMWKPVLAISLIVTALSMSACAKPDNSYFRPSDQRIELPEEVPVQETVVETTDGVRLFAWQLEAAQGCPTMLMFHGRSGHIGKGVHKYQRVHQAGLGLLAVSWRGYAGSTGTPSEAGLYEDAASAHNFLVNNGVSPENIVVHGFSLGAGPAVKLASEADIGALVLEAPALSILQLFRERQPNTPASQFNYHAFRSDLFIPEVTAPILMVHGDADTAIPPHHSEQLAALASVPVKRVIMAGGTHTSLPSEGLYEATVWPFLLPLYPDCPFIQTGEEN